MMRKKILTLILVSACFSCTVYSQSQSAARSRQKIADSLAADSWFSIYNGGGILECSANGIQFRIAAHHVLGVKYSSYIISGKGFIFPLTGGGPGGSYTYITGNDDTFNAFSAEMTYFMRTTHESVHHGIGSEITAGHKEFSRGLHLHWAFGISGSFCRRTPNLYLPVLKLGCNYCF